ncbi:hypothetical protein [Lactococcus taiwanensis]|uniref:hypothetical protein n=1 Tax=Lactococcus taiwanensis TaxID=1151742 RepID=UPI003512F040
MVKANMAQDFMALMNPERRTSKQPVLTDQVKSEHLQNQTKETVRQRKFVLTDSQFETFKAAAVQFGFVRPSQNGTQANASGFLQKIIETHLWELLEKEEVAHE